MATVLAALIAGLLFGLGLTISQMINPSKVIGFLDLVGDWDPSLAFVMLTAIPARRSDIPSRDAAVLRCVLPSSLNRRRAGSIET